MGASTSEVPLHLPAPILCKVHGSCGAFMTIGTYECWHLHTNKYLSSQRYTRSYAPLRLGVASKIRVPVVLRHQEGRGYLVIVRYKLMNAPMT